MELGELPPQAAADLLERLVASGVRVVEMAPASGDLEAALQAMQRGPYG